MGKLPVGIQLYTVRDALKTEFKSTIKALAEMGYQGVEFAWNYGDMKPEELRGFLDECGLKSCGLHGPIDDLANPDCEAYAYAAAIDASYVTSGIKTDTPEMLAEGIEKIKRAGATAQTKGVVFTYHNHAHEFVKHNGAYALDTIYAETDPATVQAEIDTYWVLKGGEDPAKYIRQYAGRVPQVHMKDMDAEDQSFAPVGEGTLDLPDVLAAAEEVGAEWLIVEQDTCKGDALDCVRRSLENLKQQGYGK